MIWCDCLEGMDGVRVAFLFGLLFVYLPVCRLPPALTELLPPAASRGDAQRLGGDIPPSGMLRGKVFP
jgi:hypothetical protein